MYCVARDCVFTCVHVMTWRCVGFQTTFKKALFSSLGFSLLRASGPGDLFLAADASIVAMEVPANDTVIIDNGHVVAFPDGTRFEVEMVPTVGGSYFRGVASGESVVLRFWGPTTVFVATRKAQPVQVTVNRP